MKKIKLTLIILFVRLLSFTLKLTGRGSGTALPGLIIEKHFPWVKDVLLGQIKHSVAITGTNGKTTTQTILKSILTQKGLKVLSNLAGSNMNRGIISELIKRANLTGKLDFDYAIYELEEATFPKIIEAINPEYIIVTNLFRDQLDAYGEIDRTQKFIVDGINKIPGAKVVLNLDDPKVREIEKKVKNETVFVKLADEITKEIKFEQSSQKEDMKSSDRIILGKNCKTNESLDSQFDIEITQGRAKTLLNGLNLKVPGKYQIYNALSAVAAARLMGIDIKTIRKGIDTFEAAFGRGEEIKVGKKEIKFKILLVKNPAGCNLNLGLLQNLKKLKLLMILNDNIADGRDVSWIWDCDFEKLNGADIEYITFSGKRAADMQLRFKYALNNRKFTNVNKTFEPDIKSAINKAIKSADEGDTIYILPTYTGMLEFRKNLGKTIE